MMKKIFGLFEVGFDGDDHPREALQGLFSTREAAVAGAPQALEPEASRSSFFLGTPFDKRNRAQNFYLVEELEVVDVPSKVATKADKFLFGLYLLGSRITSSSFYNSSGGEADFKLSSPPTEQEVAVLVALGWSVSTHPEYGLHASFEQWSGG